MGAITVCAAARRQRGWSQQRLADEAKVARSTVAAIEAGATFMGPGAEEVARVLDVELAALSQPVVVHRRPRGNRHVEEVEAGYAVVA